MRPLIHLVTKEWLVLLHDWHALLLLFAMPVLFILVMSLALRDRFAAHKGVALDYYLIDQDQQAASKLIGDTLRAETSFHLLAADSSEDELRARVGRDKAHFLIVIPADFDARIEHADPLPIRVYAGPGTDPAVMKLFESAVRGAATRVYTDRVITSLKSALPAPRGAPGPEQVDANATHELVVQGIAGEHGVAPQPSAVQQNVPAWLVFAMFFIALPLSTTWVHERQQGTFARLKAMGLARQSLLIGKLVPYYAINLLQVVLMLMVGVYVVPLFAGDALTLGHAPGALVLMAMAVSFASVSYGLLIANIVSTSEQATIFTGVCNLLLAVLGGIMVPRFLMPQTMQDISLYSPMAWGLEGFLDIFLRQGKLMDVLPESMLLIGFGLASLLTAFFVLGRTQAK